MSKSIVRRSLPLLFLPAITWTLGCADSAVLDQLTNASASLDATDLVANVDDALTAVLSTEFAAESDAEVAAELTVDSTVVDETYEDVPLVGISESEVAIPDDDAFTTPEPEGVPLQSGTLRGRYVRVRDQQRPANDPNTDRHPPAQHFGRFRGEWMNEDGTVSGVFRGRFVDLRRTELPEELVAGGVFSGVYVANGGEVHGLIKGRYGQNASGEGHFVGRWVDPDEHLLGAMRGRWQDDPNAPGGIIAGHWVQFDVCREADSLPPFEFNPNDLGGLDDPNRMPPPADTAEIAIAEAAPVNDVDQPLICGLMPAAVFRGHYHPHRPDPNDPSTMRRPGGDLRGLWLSPDKRPLALLGRYMPFPPPDPNDPNFVPPIPPDPNDPNFIPPDPNDPNAVRPMPRPRLLGVFYAKLVDNEGTTHGYIRGVYGLSRRHVGVLRAQWLDENAAPLGVIKGHWLPTPRRPGGPFRGAAFLIAPDEVATVSETGAGSS